LRRKPHLATRSKNREAGEMDFEKFCGPNGNDDGFGEFECGGRNRNRRRDGDAGGSRRRGVID